MAPRVSGSSLVLRVPKMDRGGSWLYVQSAAPFLSNRTAGRCGSAAAMFQSQKLQKAGTVSAVLNEGACIKGVYECPVCVWGGGGISVVRKKLERECHSKRPQQLPCISLSLSACPQDETQVGLCGDPEPFLDEGRHSAS